MALDVTSYTNALSSFYKEVGDWYFAKNANDKNIKNIVASLKEKARLLKIELNELPPSMVRPQVIEHIEKVLTL
ncbi:MAG: hypothetical protein IJ341_12615 [Bacteroidales bacterium]|nr:hypothetical protein [Bacteroidales bacterium]